MPSQNSSHRHCSTAVPKYSGSRNILQAYQLLLRNMSQPTHQAGEMDKKPPAAKGPPPIKRQRLEAVKDSTVPCLANNASALLTSSLLGEIVAHQIMAFLDPKEILVFLQTQPTICKKFHLDTFFCVQHGNKMEMKPSAMVWNGHLDTETPRKIIEGVVYIVLPHMEIAPTT
ncbi:hypothetical protein IV203_035255 [Nitzschia inconspicua]|uniref:Uncharacterized protein n=1 Tax=Nitzschia inconspicua TaxID=303405 RepID=A0A9K3LFW3_9STRA|nr:hypothetical protein IV203_035255 [Nitzschia inconspicua]